MGVNIRSCWPLTDTLQPLATRCLISRSRKWMDGCLLLFVPRGSMMQRSTTEAGPVRLERPFFPQRSQTSQNNLTSQLSRTCHISSDVYLSRWVRRLLLLNKDTNLYISWQNTLNSGFAVEQNDSCKCCSKNCANIITASLKAKKGKTDAA